MTAGPPVVESLANRLVWELGEIEADATRMIDEVALDVWVPANNAKRMALTRDQERLRRHLIARFSAWESAALPIFQVDGQEAWCSGQGAQLVEPDQGLDDAGRHHGGCPGAGEDQRSNRVQRT